MRNRLLSGVHAEAGSIGSWHRGTAGACGHFANAERFQLIGEYVGVETGKGYDALDRRPHLAQALAAAGQARCPVIAAKLDRLSRDVAFISGLSPSTGGS